MKKALYTLIAAYISVSCSAQIPNFSFENWTNMGNYSNPDEWGTLNNTTDSAGIYTVTKGSPGNPGTAYIRITSRKIGAIVAPGIAVSGVLDSISHQPVSGFSFTQRPAYLTGKWQHMLAGTSAGAITATLTRWDTANSHRQIIAVATVGLTGMAMNWANFTIPFVYQSGSNPDTCIIVMAASGQNPANGDYLWVDNLAFSGTVGIEEPSLISTGVTVQNPATDLLNYELTLTAKTNVIVELLSIDGQLIRSTDLGIMAGTVNRQMPLDGLAKGSYMFRVITGSDCVSRIIIIE